MKRVLIIAAGAALCCATAAHAAPAALSEAFRNTIVSTYPDGRQAKLWLAEGGTYTAEGRRHDRSNGTWKLKGADQICLKQSHPATVPISYCTAVPSGGVGATWSAKSVFGDPLKVKLVAGR
jgi:hypothetical protein